MTYIAVEPPLYGQFFVPQESLHSFFNGYVSLTRVTRSDTKLTSLYGDWLSVHCILYFHLSRQCKAKLNRSWEDFVVLCMFETREHNTCTTVILVQDIWPSARFLQFDLKLYIHVISQREHKLETYTQL